MLGYDKLSDNTEVYNKYVEEITPTTNIYLNVLRAYLVGGIICTIGEFIHTMLMNAGLSEKNAAYGQILILISVAIILTGFNVYYKITKFGGAGSLVPITGFANSVASPAIEYQKEGQVFGIGCKIFTIAGPVILYGIVCSWLLGLIYFIWGIITK
ncbi:MAG: SpoVA/SpoVAEb family sporulation membrane protein [Lachnospiraceae bacterium]|nr:SpoVA/SpoVAEb family sporulation membrane protein [Lachnospiraceae bacterium]